MKKLKLKKESQEQVALKNQLARALADYDNLQKRVEKQKEELGRILTGAFAVRLLPIFDMIQSAQNHLNDQGIALTLNEFRQVLKEEGIEEINLKEGDGFDEELAEAVDTNETGEKEREGKISEVLVTGWKFKDGGVIRHAKVKVYKFGEKKDKEVK